MTIAALPAFTRTTLEPRLPDWVEPRWWADPAEAVRATGKRNDHGDVAAGSRALAPAFFDTSVSPFL